MVAVVRSQIFLVLVTGVALLATAGRAEASPILFNPANGHYYTLTTGMDNWLQAEAEAVSLNGHLVSITDQTEQNFVVASFLSGSNDRTIYWIGATDQTQEGTFSWTNGDPFSYSFWNPGEPNNCFCVVGGEDYGTINWHYGLFQSVVKGTWNDTSLTGSEFGPQPFGITQGIVEFDTNPVPEPATLLLLGTGLMVAYRKRLGRRG